MGIVQRIEAGERLSAVAGRDGHSTQVALRMAPAYRALGAAGLNHKRGPKPGGTRQAGSPRGHASSDAPPCLEVAPSLARPGGIRRKLADARARTPNSSASSAGSRRTFIFFEKPCGSGTRPARRPAHPSLRGRPKNDRRRAARLSPRRRQHQALVRARGRVARGLLTPFRTSSPSARGRGFARSHSGHRVGRSPLRLSASDPRLAAAGPDRQRQARAQIDTSRPDRSVSAVVTVRPSLPAVGPARLGPTNLYSAAAIRSRRLPVRNAFFPAPRRRASALAALVALGLAACGRYGPLEPPPDAERCGQARRRGR